MGIESARKALKRQRKAEQKLQATFQEWEESRYYAYLKGFFDASGKDCRKFDFAELMALVAMSKRMDNTGTENYARLYNTIRHMMEEPFDYIIWRTPFKWCNGRFKYIVVHKLKKPAMVETPEEKEMRHRKVITLLKNQTGPSANKMNMQRLIDGLREIYKAQVPQ